MAKAWTGSSRGVDWQLDLASDGLLPGRLVDGRIRVSAQRRVEARGLLVTLRGEEHWKYEVTTTDAQGHTHTSRKTGRADLPPEGVRVTGPIVLEAGETREAAIELPGPPLGPPTVIAEMAGVDWTVEAKLDIEGGADSSIEFPVRVLQPVALLRAGVVDVGEFALYPSADARDGGVTAAIALDPMPLGSGMPFSGRVTLQCAEPVKVREIRAALKVKVKATVSGGLDETITAWEGVIAGPGTIAGELALDVSGVVNPAAPPTVELPHGRASATFEVTLDRAWSTDPHLVRDVTIASTLEL
jgi:hypothetical protein